MTAPEQAAPARAGVSPVITGRRHGLPGSAPAERIVREVEAVDAWIRARRHREHTLHVQARSREARMIATREIEALDCTHEAIKRQCDAGLEVELEPLRTAGPTAVIAHRHAWFLDKLSLLLAERGIEVLVATDNGAQALGAVIAGQPDLLLVSDRIAMICGRVLLAETRRYAPGARLAAQAADAQEADALHAAADMVLLRQHAPDVIADALVALHLSPWPSAPADVRRSSH